MCVSVCVEPCVCVCVRKTGNLRWGALPQVLQRWLQCRLTRQHQTALAHRVAFDLTPYLKSGAGGTSLSQVMRLLDGRFLEKHCCLFLFPVIYWRWWRSCWWDERCVSSADDWPSMFHLCLQEVLFDVWAGSVSMGVWSRQCVLWNSLLDLLTAPHRR